MHEGNIGRETALFCRYAFSPERSAGEKALKRNNSVENPVSKPRSISPPHRWKNHRLMGPNAAALRLGLGIPRIIFDLLGKECGKASFSEYGAFR